MRSGLVVKETAGKYLPPFPQGRGMYYVEGGMTKLRFLTNMSLYFGNDTR